MTVFLDIPPEARLVSAKKLILRALGRIGVTTPTEEPAAEDVQSAFDGLNEMLSQWGVQTLLVPSLQRQTLTLTAGQSVYTIGPDGDIDLGTTPVAIDRGLTVAISGVTYQVLPWTDGEFSEIQYKATRGRPEYFVYAADQPGQIEFYPVPDAPYVISVPVAKNLDFFTEYDQEVILPSGYEAALSWSLAEYLMGDYGRDLARIIRMAKRYRDAVKRRNVDNVFWSQPPGRPYNILTNQ